LSAIPTALSFSSTRMTLFFSIESNFLFFSPHASSKTEKFKKIKIFICLTRFNLCRNSGERRSPLHSVFQSNGEGHRGNPPSTKISPLRGFENSLFLSPPLLQIHAFSGGKSVF